MGGLLAFRVENFDTTAEREQFRFLCEQLKVHYEYSDEFCVFVGNYNIGCELDALFIKKDAIIVIEFKNYGGKVIANENGEWTCNGKAIKGGSRKTVLQQARINHSTVKKELKILGVSRENVKDVPSLIIFNQPVEITNNLSATSKSWLHITDNEHFLEKLDDITCPRTDLDPLGIVNLAETLNLNSFYLTEFSNATYDTHRESTENIDLFEYIRKLDTQTKEKTQNETKEKKVFLDLDSFVIENEEGFALSDFVKKIVSLSLNLENFTVKVLDGKKASSPFVSHGITLTQKYVVIISADGIGEHCAKLTKFTNHDVKAISPLSLYLPVVQPIFLPFMPSGFLTAWQKGIVLGTIRSISRKCTFLLRSARLLYSGQRIPNQFFLICTNWMKVASITISKSPSTIMRGKDLNRMCLLLMIVWKHSRNCRI